MYTLFFKLNLSNSNYRIINVGIKCSICSSCVNSCNIQLQIIYVFLQYGPSSSQTSSSSLPGRYNAYETSSGYQLNSMNCSKSGDLMESTIELESSIKKEDLSTVIENSYTLENSQNMKSKYALGSSFNVTFISSSNSAVNN